MNRLLILLGLCLGTALMQAQEDITTGEIEAHIAFLTADAQGGRPTGGKQNRAVVRYLMKAYAASGIAMERQKFKARIRTAKGEAPGPERTTWNLVGILEGNDPVLKHEYIVIGAHYDHLGLGGPSSKSDKKNAIHHGADDNASGTAALLEIAEKVAAHKDELKRSVIFIAFGAEEQGLLGSRYFTEHPTVPLSQIKLMFNMDMVGRLNDQNHVYMGGAGTFPGGIELMKELGPPLGLTPIVHAGSVGGSDHVSFYKMGISVVGLHTGGHPQYHTPEDTLDLINLEGEKKVCKYIYQALMHEATGTEELHFIPQD